MTKRNKKILNQCLIAYGQAIKDSDNFEYYHEFAHYLFERKMHSGVCTFIINGLREDIDFKLERIINKYIPNNSFSVFWCSPPMMCISMDSMKWSLKFRYDIINKELNETKCVKNIFQKILYGLGILK